MEIVERYREGELGVRRSDWVECGGSGRSEEEREVELGRSEGLEEDSIRRRKWPWKG